MSHPWRLFRHRVKPLTVEGTTSSVTGAYVTHINLLKLSSVVFIMCHSSQYLGLIFYNNKKNGNMIHIMLLSKYIKWSLFVQDLNLFMFLLKIQCTLSKKKVI